MACAVPCIAPGHWVYKGEPKRIVNVDYREDLDGNLRPAIVFELYVWDGKRWQPSTGPRKQFLTAREIRTMERVKDLDKFTRPAPP